MVDLFRCLPACPASKQKIAAPSKIYITHAISNKWTKIVHMFMNPHTNTSTCLFSRFVALAVLRAFITHHIHGPFAASKQANNLHSYWSEGKFACKWTKRKKRKKNNNNKTSNKNFNGPKLKKILLWNLFFQFSYIGFVYLVNLHSLPIFYPW